MKCNVGGVDRTIRITMGAALLAVGFFARMNRGTRTAALAVGGMELLTGLSRYCPVSELLGVNTCAADPMGAVEQAVEKAKEFA